MRVFLKPFQTTVGGNKRYKSLTGKLIHAATMLRESDAYGPTV